MKPSGDTLNKLLLVEDNPMDVDLTRRAFAMNNLPVTIDVASDGEEAIGYIKKWEAGLPLPKVILLDLKLPKIGGLQVLKTIKLHSIYQHIPSVVLTSSSEERDVYTAYEYGANSYIIKEIDFDKFLEIAVQIEYYWCRLNILPRQS
jgi:CheY-like chemotaxis protein